MSPIHSRTVSTIPMSKMHRQLHTTIVFLLVLAIVVIFACLYMTTKSVYASSNEILPRIAIAIDHFSTTTSPTTNTTSSSSSSTTTVSQFATTLASKSSKLLPAKRKSSAHSLPIPDITFIHSAYLIDDHTIRLTTVRPCKSRSPIWGRLSHSTIAQRVSTVTIGVNCPWWYARQCHLVGHYGHIHSMLPYKYNESAGSILLTSNREQKGVSIPVQDVRTRVDTKLPHQLGVCLQPVFLLADWTLLVQFFEIWIAHGVTLFFIYVQSMSPEVAHLLHAYESLSKITVIRVQWPALPITANSFDPNDFVYRTEVVTAINDCILRSRAQAEYVIASDLDEIIMPFGNRSIYDLIQDYRWKKDSIVALVVRSSNVRFQNTWQLASHPSQLNFSSFSSVERETKVWPSGSRSKLIVMPARIRTAHVHTVTRLESRHDAIAIVKPEHAIVYHLRRVLSRNTPSTRREDKTLGSHVDKWDRQWGERLQLWQDESRLKGEWPNRGIDVMLELEKCLLEDFKKRGQLCNSAWRCRHRIQTVKDEEWVWANQTWLAL